MTMAPEERKALGTSRCPLLTGSTAKTVVKLMVARPARLDRHGGDA